MDIWIHPHAEERMAERGATAREIKEVVEEGRQFPAKFGRVGFRHNFSFNTTWRNKKYKTKQVEVIGSKEQDVFVIITILVKYF